MAHLNCRGPAGYVAMLLQLCYADCSLISYAYACQLGACCCRSSAGGAACVVLQAAIRCAPPTAAGHCIEFVAKSFFSPPMNINVN